MEDATHTKEGAKLEKNRDNSDFEASKLRTETSGQQSMSQTTECLTTGDTQNLESASIAAGFVRVKYDAVWKGSATDFMHENPGVQNVFYKTASELAIAAELLEASGAAPVAEDDKVAGNVAARIVMNDVDFLVVSKSGKQAGGQVSVEDDFCIVTEFDPVQWSLNYYAQSPSILPTSDSPLHHAVLHAASQFGWSEAPYASLHGHALESSDEAERLGIPCSTKETLFSTPDDMHELLSLVKEHPYPADRIYVRKGHGFLVLGKTVAEAVETFKAQVVPYIAQ